MEKQVYQYGRCRTCKESKVIYKDNGDERDGKTPIGTCTECRTAAVPQADGVSE